MTQDRLKSLPGLKPPKGPPLELSTPAQSDSTQSHNRTIAPTQQQTGPKRTKRGYAFREDLVKACKQIALDTDRTLYEVMEEAISEYLEMQKDPLFMGSVSRYAEQNNLKVSDLIMLALGEYLSNHKAE